MTQCPFNDQAGKECIHRGPSGECSGSCARLNTLQAKPWTYQRMDHKTDFEMTVKRLPWNPRTGTEYQVHLTVDYWDHRETAHIKLTPEGLRSLKKWIDSEIEAEGTAIGKALYTPKRI